MVQLPAAAAIEYVAAGHFFPGGLLPGALLAGGTFGRWDFCPGGLLSGGLLPGGTSARGFNGIDGHATHHRQRQQEVSAYCQLHT